VGGEAACEEVQLMRRPSRHHAAVFQVKVALAAITGEQMLAELAQNLYVHPNRIMQWKVRLQERAADLCGGAGKPQDAEGPRAANSLEASL
jgi:transposase